MMFEFRFYDLTPGRVGEELERVFDVAYTAAKDGPTVSDNDPSMWARNDVPQPSGVWVATAGAYLPRCCYILAWENAAHRDRGFPSFWADPAWLTMRANTEGQLAEKTEDWLMLAQPAWLAQLEAPDSAPLGPVQELRYIYGVDGHDDAADRAFAHCVFPHLRAHGGRIVGAFELSTGPRLPVTLLFSAWPSLEAAEQAWDELDLKAPSLKIRAASQSQIGAVWPFRGSDCYLLEPVPFAKPKPNFGVQQ